MNVQLTDAAKEEIAYHCNTVWPLISISPPDPIAIAMANHHLDRLEATDYPMYDVVMQVLGKAKGLDWRAVAGADR